MKSQLKAAIEQAIVGGFYVPMIVLGALLVIIGATAPLLSASMSMVYINCGVALAAVFAWLAHKRLAKWRRGGQVSSE